MKIACLARLVKRLGFLVVFIALVRCATNATFFTGWGQVSYIFGNDLETEISAALVTHSVMAARYLGEAEGELVYGWALSHAGAARDACDLSMTLLLVVIGYVLYILSGAVARHFGKSAAETEVREGTWAWVAMLILVPLFVPPLVPLRYHTAEKTVTRCREIAQPQNLDPSVKTLVNIILEKESER